MVRLSISETVGWDFRQTLNIPESIVKIHTYALDS
jgi:hypothetical protein